MIISTKQQYLRNYYSEFKYKLTIYSSTPNNGTKKNNHIVHNICILKIINTKRNKKPR